MLSDRLTPQALTGFLPPPAAEHPTHHLVRVRVAHPGKPAVIAMAAVSCETTDILAKWQAEANQHADARNEPRPTLTLLGITPVSPAELNAMRGNDVYDGFDPAPADPSVST